MANTIVQIPKTNEIRFAPEAYPLPAKYHQQQFDRDWFYNLTLKSFQKPYWYRIFKQFNDNNCIQIHSNENLVLKIYNTQAQVLATVSPQYNVLFPGNEYNGFPMRTFQWQFNLEDLGIITQGTYYYIISATGYIPGDPTTLYLSEPIWAKEDWPNTNLFEYRHNKNEFYTIFSLNPRFSQRVPGYIIYEDTEAKDTQYIDQEDSNKTLSTKTARKFRWEIGGNKGIATWQYDRIVEGLKCKTKVIEGVQYDKDEGAKFELESSPTYNMVNASILLQEYNPVRSFTYAQTELVIFNLREAPTGVVAISMTDASGGIIMLLENTVIEDEADGVSRITALTAIATANGLTGEFVQSGDDIVYRNGVDENFTLYDNYVLLKSFTAAVSVPSNSANYRFTYAATDYSLVDWDDGNVERLNIPATMITTIHNFGTNTGDKDVRIFHNDSITLFSSTQNGDVAKLKGITGSMSAFLKNHTVNYTDPTSDSWNLNYLIPCATRIEGLSIQNTDIETFNTVFNSAKISLGIKGFRNLRSIVISGNSLTQAGIESFITDFVANANYAYNGITSGSMFIVPSSQDPATTYSGPATTAKNTLTTAVWTVL